MDRRIALVALCLLAAAGTLEAASARDTFNLTVRHEQAVRAAMLPEDAPPETVTEVRAVVAEYQALVKRYPSSTYGDAALWQAGRLSIDAFLRFGQPREKSTATRLFRALTTSYPASKLVKQVPAQLARLEAPDAAISQGVGAAPETKPPHAIVAPRSAAPAAPAASVSPEPKPSPAIVAPHSTAPAVSAAPEPKPATAIAALRAAAAAASAATAPPGAGAGDIAARAPTTPAAPLSTIRDIRRALLPDVVRVIVELDVEAAFHQEHLKSPERVFVDFSSARAAPTLVDRTLRFDGDGDLVTKIRIGRHPNNTIRVVVDTEGVASYTVYSLYDPYRLVIDCARPSVTNVSRVQPFAPDAPGRPAASPTRAPAIIVDAVSPASASRLTSGEDSATTIAPPTSSTANPASKNSGGGFSIARQLGLGVSRIVIDPGHGGHDPGAQGKNINEAELVLDVALRLEKLLLKTPGTDVILTRRGDDYVPLPERTSIANREGADLFLSIHANANPNDKARGVETYFLNFASNLSAAAVAARENAASGQAMGALPDFVKAIALNNKLDESRDLAAHVQQAMVERLHASNKGVKNLGVKQAPFVVLIGAAMPSVLVEISFLTNAQDAKLLRGGAYRQRIAEALCNAIRKYQTSLISTKIVAQRRATQ